MSVYPRPDFNHALDPKDPDHQAIPDVPGDLFAERLGKLQAIIKAERESSAQTIMRLTQRVKFLGERLNESDRINIPEDLLQALKSLVKSVEKWDITWRSDY